MGKVSALTSKLKSAQFAKGGGLEGRRSPQLLLQTLQEICE